MCWWHGCHLLWRRRCGQALRRRRQQLSGMVRTIYIVCNVNASLALQRWLELTGQHCDLRL